MRSAAGAIFRVRGMFACRRCVLFGHEGNAAGRTVRRMDCPGRDVQNAVESLPVGKGMQEGIDYDRETGRVKRACQCLCGRGFLSDIAIDRYQDPLCGSLLERLRAGMDPRAFEGAIPRPLRILIPPNFRTYASR